MTGILVQTVAEVHVSGGHESISLTLKPYDGLQLPEAQMKRPSTIAIKSEPHNSVSICNCKDLEELMGIFIVPNTGDRRGPSFAQIDGIQPHDQIHPRADGTIDLVINGIPVINFKLGSDEDTLAQEIKKKFTITELKDDLTTLKIEIKDPIAKSTVSDLVYTLHLIANHELKALDVNIDNHSYSISPGHLPVETFRKIKENKS